MRSSHLWLPALCILLTGSVPPASADNNPLNLPLPLDSRKLGTIMLHGGGGLTQDFREKFVELAGGKDARIVLIPSGTFVRGIDDDYREFDETEEAFVARITPQFRHWLDLKKQRRIAAIRFLYTDNQQDADNPAFVAALKDATGVWIPAAFQGKLNWRFAPNYPEKTSLFQKALRDVVARGGVVGGMGGGMAALPEVMILGDTGQEQGPAEPRIRHGVALFSGAIVDQYFDARGGRLERFTALLKDTAMLNRWGSWPAAGRSMIGLAVEPRTALLLQGSSVRAIGCQRGHVFVKSNGDRTITWRVLSESDGKVDLVSSSQLAGAQRQADSRQAHPDQSWKNPFGMPAPGTVPFPAQPGHRPGTVVLHGGGGNNDLIPIYPRLCGLPRPRLVHCPAASHDWRPRPGEPLTVLVPQMESHFHEWVALLKDGQLASLQFLTTAHAADANDADFVKPLLSADAVWFSGGSQDALGELFVGRGSLTLFQRELFNVLRRGGIVGGTSAGAAIMPEIITVADVQRGGRPFDAETAHGLGVLQNVLVEQHFQGSGRGGRIERFTRLLLDNDRLRKLSGRGGPRPEEMIGLAIEERTSLILQENRVEVFGQQKAHVFLKSADQKTITWHALYPGDAAFVYHGPGGPILELDEWHIEPR
jgi:cyanophycinase